MSKDGSEAPGSGASPLTMEGYDVVDNHDGTETHESGASGHNPNTTLDVVDAAADLEQYANKLSNAVDIARAAASAMWRLDLDNKHEASLINTHARDLIDCIITSGKKAE